MIRWSVLGLGLLTYGAFALAYQFFFVAPAKSNKSVLLMKGAGSLAILLNLYFLWRPVVYSNARFLIGDTLFLSSLALFFSAIFARREKRFLVAFAKNVPSEIVTNGPYRRIRHPFYASYTLGWIAGAVGSGQVWLYLVVLVLFAFYYRAAWIEEAKFRESQFSEAYENYRRQTGMFVPWKKGK